MPGLSEQIAVFCRYLDTERNVSPHTLTDQEAEKAPYGSQFPANGALFCTFTQQRQIATQQQVINIPDPGSHPFFTGYEACQLLQVQSIGSQGVG
jgi:hypothetical protein